MMKNEKENNESTGLSNDALWNKAGTSQPIVRADIGVSTSGDCNGVRVVRDGLNILKYNDESGRIYKGSDE